MATEPSPPAPADAPPAPGRRRSVPHQAPWHGRLLAAVIYGLVRGLDATMRYELSDPAEVLPAALAEPVVFCIWHNRLALSLRFYRRYIQRARPRRRLAALVSASRDGALLARALELFGVEPVRGSTSRRGPQALLELTSCAERGLDLAITPDGPRGPCCRVQEGVISLAQLTGLPILPVSAHFQRKVRLKSWDAFQVPVPLSRCTLCLGPLLRVPRETTGAEREASRQELERRMLALTPD